MDNNIADTQEGSLPLENGLADKIEDNTPETGRLLGRLKELEKSIKRTTEDGRDKDILAQYESGELERLKSEVHEVKQLLEESKPYLNSFADVANSFGDTYGELCKDISDKLKSDYKEFTEDDEKSADEIQAEARAAEAQQQFSAVALEMQELQQLAAVITESAHKSSAAAARAVSRSEVARGHLNEAGRQAEVESGKKRQEEEDIEKQRMEAEKKAREEEEKERKIQEKKRKEEERQKEEEKRKAEEERKKQEKEDPKHWPTHVYGSTDAESDYLSHGIACIFRTRGSAFQRSHVTCRTLTALESNLLPAEHEEIVGNIVHIKPTHGANLEGAVWLAMPFVGARLGPTKETIIRQRDSKGTWHDLYARETAIPDQFDAKFMETPLRKLEEMTLAPVTRLKCDNVRVSARGGKIASSADHRVVVHVPKGSFARFTEVNLKVQHMDSSTLNEIKSRNETCTVLMGTSPMIMWRFNDNPDKPLKITMPGPSGGTRKRPKTTGENRKQSAVSGIGRPATTWGGKPHRDDGTGLDDQVHVAVKSHTGHWHDRPDVKLLHNRDLLTLELDDIGESLLLLRLQGHVDSSVVAKIAAAVESSFQDRAVCVLLRQMSADQSQIHVELCKSDRLEKRLHTLGEQGYDAGPSPSHELFLIEGDKIEMRFRGNVNFTDDQPRSLIYHSNLRSAKTEATVRELDKFAQHGLEFYRGYLQIFIKRRFKGKHTPKRGAKHIEEKQDDWIKITELAATLPKPTTELTNIVRAPVKFRSQGPLTMEYFEELREALGDEWKYLGVELGVSKARVQSIISNSANGGTRMNYIQEMLMTWFKGSSASNDKVLDLYWALKSVNRDELAADLASKNEEFKEEQEKKIEEEKMRQSFKAVTDSTTALLQWKTLAQALGVSGDKITDIDSLPDSVSMREKATQALYQWREKEGVKATRQRLIRVLRKLDMMEAAENIIRLR